MEIGLRISTGIKDRRELTGKDFPLAPQGNTKHFRDTRKATCVWAAKLLHCAFKYCVFKFSTIFTHSSFLPVLPWAQKFVISVCLFSLKSGCAIKLILLPRVQCDDHLCFTRTSPCQQEVGHRPTAHCV